MSTDHWKLFNPAGKRRVIVTKSLPGNRWREVLLQADCRIEVCGSPSVLSSNEIQAAIGRACDGAIGQLTENWDDQLFAALAKAGGRAYSNYAVGYNNVDLEAATQHGIPVGNTPGVLTEATAELAVALTLAAIRRLGEAERFLRGGRFKGWLPDLFLGDLLYRKTLGIIGAGRIGQAYGRMLVAGHHMNLIYFGPHPKKGFQQSLRAFGEYLGSQGDTPVTCRYTDNLFELLSSADVVSLHVPLTPATHHLIDTPQLAAIKKDGILINTSRGPVVNEAALVAHCRNNPRFRAGLDVFEREPELHPGLVDLDNVVILPHIASATRWTREGMATLAAANVAAILSGYPVWSQTDIHPFLEPTPPKAAPSIVNAKDLDLVTYKA
jgi:hydroxypyruvate reductase 1